MFRVADAFIISYLCKDLDLLEFTRFHGKTVPPRNDTADNNKDQGQTGNGVANPKQE